MTIWRTWCNIVTSLVQSSHDLNTAMVFYLYDCLWYVLFCFFGKISHDLPASLCPRSLKMPCMGCASTCADCPSCQVTTGKTSHTAHYRTHMACMIFDFGRICLEFGLWILLRVQRDGPKMKHHKKLPHKTMAYTSNCIPL